MTRGVLLAALVLLSGRLTITKVMALAIFVSLFIMPFFGNGDYDRLMQISEKSGLIWVFRVPRVMNDCGPFIIFMLIGTLVYLWYCDRCKLSQCMVASIGLFALFATTFLLKPNGAQQLHTITDGSKVLILFSIFMLWQKRGPRFHWFEPFAVVLDKLGNISYPLYLVHGMTGMTIGNLIWLKTGSANAAVLIGGTITFVLAWIIHRAAEIPGQKIGTVIGRKYFGTSRAEAKPVTLSP